MLKKSPGFHADGDNRPVQRGGAVLFFEQCKYLADQFFGIGVRVQAFGGGGDQRECLVFGNGNDPPKSFGYEELLGGIVLKLLTDGKQECARQIAHAHAGCADTQQRVVDGGSVAQQGEALVRLETKGQRDFLRVLLQHHPINALPLVEQHFEQKVRREEDDQGRYRELEYLEEKIHAVFLVAIFQTGGKGNAGGVNIFVSTCV